MLPTQEYLDFELNIEALPNNMLRVTVANSPVGSVTAETPLTVTAMDIRRVTTILDGTIPSARGETARMARALGEKLFSMVFTGQIYAAYLASRNQAGGAGLRIRLGLDSAPDLIDWPWELLRDPSGDYLTLSRQTPIIRYPRVLTTRPVVEVTLPLRVLVMISSPSDQAQLNVEAEWAALLESTAEVRARGLLALDRVDDAHLVNLQRKLREGTNYQIFHYIGHAAFNEQSKTGVLALEDPRTNATAPVSGESLARELVEENSIRLVVLNACQGARQDGGDRFAGIASSIVARGIPAVVAMQFPISDEASRIFSREFYKAVAEGYPIEAATAEARRAIGSTLNNFEWATPVLFLRAPNGMLFPKAAVRGRVSQGGLREAIWRPPLLLGIIGMLVVVVGLLALSGRGAGNTPEQPTPPPIIATLTPTPDAPRDIDLVITGVRPLQRSAAPGQLVTFSISIRNNGQSASGPFKWAWFATNPQENPEPAAQGEIANLPPNTTTSVKADYPFPWWGSYITTAWVNADNAAPETNIFNNIVNRSFTVSEQPFDVDFFNRPGGLPIEPGPLKGDEFAKWELGMSPVADGACAGAKLQLSEAAGVLGLGTRGADSPATCRNLPIRFVLSRPAEGPSIADFTVEFLATAAGTYTLEAQDGAGQPLRRETLTLNVTQINTEQRLTLRATNVPLDSAVIVFRPADGANTVIRRILRNLTTP
jgi:hypothetical protein